jgi:hypothetical protein
MPSIDSTEAKQRKERKKNEQEKPARKPGSKARTKSEGEARKKNEEDKRGRQRSIGRAVLPLALTP